MSGCVMAQGQGQEKQDEGNNLEGINGGRYIIVCSALFDLRYEEHRKVGVSEGCTRYQYD
jgi:hypothetical protein